MMGEIFNGDIPEHRGFLVRWMTQEIEPALSDKGLVRLPDLGLKTMTESWAGGQGTTWPVNHLLTPSKFVSIQLLPSGPACHLSPTKPMYSQLRETHLF